MRTVHTVLLGASLASLLFGCTAQTGPEGELTGEQSAALEAAIEGVAEHRASLPAADAELVELGSKFVLKAEALAQCEHRGIVSGIWYDEQLQPVLEGSWFELGSNDLGGSVQGQYGAGAYAGQVSGPDLSGEVDGHYDQGLFVGQWSATVGDDAELHDGELIGRYERRNEVGGYFFGLWTDCGPVEDPNAP